jgi:transcription-repair coupling factor (superfamily II helicase)
MDTAVSNIIEFNSSPQPSFNKNFDLLFKDLKGNNDKGYENLIFSDNVKQIERFYAIYDDLYQKTTETDYQFKPVYNPIHAGFVDHTLKIAFYTDHQIFNRFHRYKVREGFSNGHALLLKTLKELKPGDYVTHIDHGVGKYSGLEKIEMAGHQQEAVRLIYANNDILYVHINSLHKISKFVGKDGIDPKVHKLGSDAWANLKRKTKAKIKDIAEDLIKLYAKRKNASGFAFLPDTYLQTELESSFIYEDTPDQVKATADVKMDMEKSTPMDRLVCGDVGFGKTEIAIRAAFKAVADSKQVAVLVPTTILAYQHFQTFTERLKDMPCTVDYINRFKSAKQKAITLEKLKAGKVDILIGTHGIVGKQVVFKDLGLLIIDEEQKFGVGVKEKIKEFKINVDTLTLTATPIPRTLQFSLLGARDLSVIKTPPPNRQPVVTELHVLDPAVIKDAIEKEIYRGGQVFFVHNRVADLMDIKVMLEKIVPNIDIAMAHGQLEGDKLEEVLLDFMDRKYDLLLSTNIIESGIDIPNANTIIINNAHWFGLSDLHQLRGRVGRSNKQAFCYLFSPPQSTLTKEAKERLRTIEQFSELGSGFNVALRDMDIRGAGNLLSGEQSGFIADIGYDTYHKILDEAIQELKEVDYKDLYSEENKKEEKEFARECQVETDTDMLIPDSYVRSTQERMVLYTDLNDIKTEEEIATFERSIHDRFGPLPKQIYELFDGLRLKWYAKKLGIERVLFRNKVMKCYFIQNQDSYFFKTMVFGKIIEYVSAYPVNTSMKQTGNHLILEFKNIDNLKTALAQLDFMKEKVVE